MGEPVATACARCCLEKLEDEGYRRDLFHPRFLQAAGCPGCAACKDYAKSVRPGSGLRGDSRRPMFRTLKVAAAELRLQAGGRGPRSSIGGIRLFSGDPNTVHEAGVLGARPPCQGTEKRRSRTPTSEDHIVEMAGACCRKRARLKKAAAILNVRRA